jgi:hypothetical protein
MSNLSFPFPLFLSYHLSSNSSGDEGNEEGNKTVIFLQESFYQFTAAIVQRSDDSSSYELIITVEAVSASSTSPSPSKRFYSRINLSSWKKETKKEANSAIHPVKVLFYNRMNHPSTASILSSSASSSVDASPSSEIINHFHCILAFEERDHQAAPSSNSLSLYKVSLREMIFTPFPSFSTSSDSSSMNLTASVTSFVSDLLGIKEENSGSSSSGNNATILSEIDSVTIADKISLTSIDSIKKYVVNVSRGILWLEDIPSDSSSAVSSKVIIVDLESEISETEDGGSEGETDDADEVMDDDDDDDE